MRLSKIEIKNFKTFKDVSVDFNKSNLIVGSCASGKSNFVEVFDFLRDLSIDFDKAIHQHRGAYLQNLYLNEEIPTCVKVSFDDEEFAGMRLDLSNKSIDKNENLTVQFTDFSYEICFDFKDFNSKILSEKY